MTSDPQEKRVRPAKIHLPSEVNNKVAACSLHIKGPLTRDPDKVTCRTCRRWLLPPGLPKERA